MSQLEAAVVYTVSQENAAAHRFQVTCRIAAPDPEGQVVSIPAWVPGSYMIRDYARHIISLEADVDGQKVSLHKLDKSSWAVDPGEGVLTLRAVIYANDLSVRGAYLDCRHAFLNGVCTLLRVHGQETERCVVHILPSQEEARPGWMLATTLPRLTGSTWGFGAFEASDYQELIDHPVMMGELTPIEFTAADVPHALVITGRHAADHDRLQKDLQQLCEYHIDFFGRPPPMDRYIFHLTVLNKSYGGLEHRNSSALVCSNSDLPKQGRQDIGSGYRKFLGLVSHEYFHLWNIKRIRPAEFSPYDLKKESYTRQLWIFEGITSYYDDLALLRCGLITEESYLELLGRTLTSVYRSTGRRRQTLEDSSFDAWIKFYKQDENAPNAIVSYYTKGAMVALALDLEIRIRSSDQHSLDSVVQAMWAEYGNSDSGMPCGRFEELAERVTGLDLKTFFDSNLRSTIDPSVGILLAQAGIRLNMREAMSSPDPGGKPGKNIGENRIWLGVRTRTDSRRVCVSHVLDEGPAQQAGISAGDELVALNGMRIEPGNYQQSIDGLAVADSVEIQLFRRDELLLVNLTPATAPRDTCYLTFDEDAVKESIMRRTQWLTGGVPDQE